MTFKKPHRICNTPVVIPGMAEGETNCITATLKELKDRYELRIGIPRFRKQDIDVCITDGFLYVYESSKVSGRVLGYFLLTANVQQDEIKAFYRNYGLKIVMPLARPDGKVIHIPIQNNSI